MWCVASVYAMATRDNLVDAARGSSPYTSHPASSLHIEAPTLWWQMNEHVRYSVGG